MRNQCGFSIEAVIRATGLGSMGRAATRGLALMLAVGVLLAPAIAAASCSFSRVARLPVTMEGMRASVPVTINGTPTRFWVDSGAFFSNMSRAKATELALPLRSLPDGMSITWFGGSPDVRVATVHAFVIADASLKNVEFLVGGSDYFKGGIGLSLLGAYDGDYDLANGTIDLMVAKDCAKANLAYWGGDKILSVIDLVPGATPADPYIYGRALVNGKDVRLKFDTGMQATVMTRSAAERIGIDLSAPGVVSSVQSGGISSRVRARWIVRLKSFVIGGEEIRNTPIWVIDQPGDASRADITLGADFFLAHHILVANSQHKIYLTYNGGPIFSLTTDGEIGKSVTRAENIGGADAAAAPTDAAGFARRGAARLTRGDTAGAMTDLSEAIRLDPLSAVYFRDRAQAYGASGNWVAALKDLDAAIALAPDDPQLRITRGFMRFNQHDTVGARTDADAAATLVPLGSLGNTGLVLLFERLNLPERSIALLDPMIASHRSDAVLASLLNSRCWARGLADVDLDKALADCDAAIRLDGPKPQTLDSRGLIHVRQKDYAAAIADYDAALKARPDVAGSLFMRGWAEHAAGDTGRGAADMAAAAKLDPEVRQRFQPYGFAD